MKPHLECVPCFLRQASEAIMMSTNDELVREKALREATNYLLHEKWDKPIPELGTNVHRIVKRVTGNDDPYRQLKDRCNEMASKRYPKFEQMVENSHDPFLKAAKIAIAGNAIDFGPRIEINIEKDVQEVLEGKLAINDIDQLKESAQKSKDILYLADNAGETFFDRVLIGELAKQDINVTYVVKGGPILNDATLRDAEIAGINNVAKVISTGTDCAGVLFNDCSKHFLKEFGNSSLIISKGQGNYESLNEVKNKEIFFLLKIKCRIIAEDIGARNASTVLTKFLEHE
jgi:uncharacterized protein with ATP-grasp and redox domains